MEKKRRARINKCLDQLKSLLESYYSTSVSMHVFTFKQSNFNMLTQCFGLFEESDSIKICVYSDSKAQTGKGRHPGAHCEPPKEPSTDPEL